MERWLTALLCIFFLHGSAQQERDVPFGDSLKLVHLYNAFDGPNWINADNWLISEASLWEGIGCNPSPSAELISINLTNMNLTGHIDSLVSVGKFFDLRFLTLSDNNITGKIPRLLDFVPPNPLFLTLNLSDNQLTDSFPSPEVSMELTTLNISGNQIEYMPRVRDDMFSLSTLDVSRNKLSFDDIYNNQEEFDSPLPSYTYAPQDSVGEGGSFQVGTFSDFTINLGIDDSLEGTNFQNSYTWKKDGGIINVTATNQLELTFISFSDAGTYTCEITNTNFPDLTLYMREINLDVYQSTEPFDSMVVADIYNAFDGENWTDADNWTNTPVVFWEGIIVDGESRISSIDLSNKNLTGDASGLGILNLGNLQSLNLANNSISGSIPDLFNRMAVDGRRPLDLLQTINVRNNDIEGTPDFGGSSGLRVLDLGGNDLTTVPDYNIPTLEKLLLDNNQLTTVPDFMFLPNLEVLDLSFNNMVSVPEFMDLTSINVLLLNNNELDSIPCFEFEEELDTFNVLANNLSFDDIICNDDIVDEFIFCPIQDSIGESSTVQFTPGEDVTIDLEIDEDIEDNTYRWFKDGTEILVTDENELHLTDLTLDDAGEYTCEITNPYDTCLTLFSQPVILSVLTTGIFDPSSPFLEVKVHPLPFTGFIHVSFTLDQPSEYEISMREITGRKIENTGGNYSGQPGLNTIRMAVPNDLSIGIYLLEMRSETGIWSKQVVKF